MGTSVQVFPRKFDTPTLGEVLAVASAQLHSFLAKHDVLARPTIRAQWRRGQTMMDSIAPDAPFAWPDDGRCAWFMVANVPGGTDVYYKNDAASVRRYLENELRSNANFRARAAEVHACAQVGRCWDFCRWGGAVAMTNVAYGILAASVATLTDGLLLSADGAWDHERFPADAGEFLSWWYDPAQAMSEGHRAWAAKCIEAIRRGIDNPNEVVI